MCMHMQKHMHACKEPRAVQLNVSVIISIFSHSLHSVGKVSEKTDSVSASEAYFQRVPM